MFRYYKHSFKRLLQDLRELKSNKNNTKILQHLQDTLFSRIAYIEKQIRTCRKKKEEAKWKLHHERKPREEARKIKEQITIFTIKIDEYRCLLYTFRLIGDALMYLYFSKWDIKPLYSYEAPGFITRKKGLRLERKLVRHANSKGIPTIQADLTNCLRYGDICFAVDEMPRFVEVKSGRNLNPRTMRQQKKIEQIYEYLLTDKTLSTDGNSRLQRVGLHSEEVSHTEFLNKMIQQSFIHNQCCEQPEPGIYYILMREESTLPISELLPKIKRPMIFFLNELKNNQGWNSYYPFLFSIKNSQAVVDFLDGTLIIVIILDVDNLIDRFSKKGYQVDVIEDPKWVLQVRKLIAADNEVKHIQVSHHFIGRLATEFVSLEWMVDEILSQYRYIGNVKSPINGQG